MMYVHTQSGFSIVETLVAISILLIVIVGPMTIASQASQSTNFTNEQVVATFLAQEGAELVQKARDDIILPEFTTGASTPDNSAWGSFMTTYATCFDGNGCGLEYNTDGVGSVSLINDCSGEGCRLYFNNSYGERARYTYTTTGARSVFSRRINLTDLGSNQGVRVESVVTWRTSDQRTEQSVSTVTYLYNVYGR